MLINPAFALGGGDACSTNEQDAAETVCGKNSAYASRAVLICISDASAVKEAESWREA